jgi:polyisoprenoid-binding protein YceI
MASDEERTWQMMLGTLDTKTKATTRSGNLHKPKEGSNYRDPMGEKQESCIFDAMTKRKRQRWRLQQASHGGAPRVVVEDVG